MKEPPAPVPLAVNVKEAARLLSISHWTLRRVIAEGRIRTRRINRCLVIPMTELQRFLNEGDASKNGNG